MSDLPVISIHTAIETNQGRGRGSCDQDSLSAPQLKKPERSFQPRRHRSELDDEEEEDEEGERAFSIVSFSLHGRPSVDSAFRGSKNGDAKSGLYDYQCSDLKVLGYSDEKVVFEEEEDVYPDGGLTAWLMVLGGTLNTFSTFGYVNSWGIFQLYYQSTMLQDSSTSNIAWIGSIQYALVFFPAILIGRLFDLGYFRSIFLTSSVVLVAATFLVAECHLYWQFLLCQGIAVGFACGGIFGPTTAVIAHWFKKRRGLAMGLVATGSSLGGAVLPVLVKGMIPRVGFKWTMRTIGFILIFSLGVSNLVLKRRIPPKNNSGGLLNLSAFRSPVYTIYCLSAFTTFLGLYTVLTYIDFASADLPGVPATLSFYLLSITNGSGFVGRYACGVISDRAGPMNVMMPFTMLAGVMTFIWPYARSAHSLVAVAVVYGLCSGAYVSLSSNPVIEMGDTSDVGRRIGMFMSILALGALGGPPISGAINTATGGFEAVGWYAGSMIFLGVAMMAIARRLVLNRWWGKI
ncbi:hypothetical protein AX14_003722 [Amanita brunnescens Koide BX004]|nr:hypothetical protein AX14_003722 [Amanita brunnescens Koide BX004]